MNVLAKKLLMKPAKKWLIYNAPANYINLLYPLPEGTSIHFKPDSAFDGLQFFVENKVQLKQSLDVLSPLIKPDTIVWVCYPKQESGMGTDLTMTGNWDGLTAHGLRIVAAAAIDETWTTLRIRPIELAKSTGVGVAGIRKNEYSAFIDVNKKTVTLHPDVNDALQSEPAAFELYQSLAYSHKKEYVMWILTAKQEKTRTDRILKMVAKLLAKKKNPSDK